MATQAKSRPSVKKRVNTPAATPRRLKEPRRRFFKRGPRIKNPHKILNSWKITGHTFALLWQHKKLFGGIILLYGILNIVLVRGFSGGTDVGSLKDTLNQVFGGHLGQVASGLGVFVLLVSSSGNTSSSTAGAYQTILVIIVSLAVVWALRQILAKTPIRIRDAFYQGMYPLIPVLLVLLVVGIQLLPLLVGSSIYSIVTSNGIAVTALERAGFVALLLLLVLWSLYMLTSSIFALYIATLPNMTPLKALRSAKQLVRYRRWTVMRKVLFLPLMLLIVAAALMLPIIIFATPAAQWVFFALTMAGVAVIHAYMYTLYRELLL